MKLVKFSVGDYVTINMDLNEFQLRHPSYTEWYHRAPMKILSVDVYDEIVLYTTDHICKSPIFDCFSQSNNTSSTVAMSTTSMEMYNLILSQDDIELSVAHIRSEKLDKLL